MLADLQKPIVPSVVQSVLASAASAAAEAQAAKNAGRSRARGGAGAGAEESNGEVAAEPIWQIPPLGHAKQGNRAEVSILLC